MLATLANDVMPDEPSPAPTHPIPLSSAWFDTEVRDIHGWSNRPVAPWRRYFARYLDTMVHGTIGYLLLGYVGGSIAPDEVGKLLTPREGLGGTFLDVIVSVFLAALVGAVVVGATGSSIGKAIFGVRVVDGTMRPIGLWRGLKRELTIWLIGLGTGIAVVSLITLVISYRRLTLRATTLWDQGQHLVLHRPARTLQTVLSAIGVILIPICFTALRYLE